MQPQPRQHPACAGWRDGVSPRGVHAVAERSRRRPSSSGWGYRLSPLPPATECSDGPMIAHSVVTNHMIDEHGEPTRAALDRVLGYFKERLLPAEAAQQL